MRIDGGSHTWANVGSIKTVIGASICTGTSVELNMLGAVTGWGTKIIEVMLAVS